MSAYDVVKQPEIVVRNKNVPNMSNQKANQKANQNNINQDPTEFGYYISENYQQKPDKKNLRYEEDQKRIYPVNEIPKDRNLVGRRFSMEHLDDEGKLDKNFPPILKPTHYKKISQELHFPEIKIQDAVFNDRIINDIDLATGKDDFLDKVEKNHLIIGENKRTNISFTPNQSVLSNFATPKAMSMKNLDKELGPNESFENKIKNYNKNENNSSIHSLKKVNLAQ